MCNGRKRVRFSLSPNPPTAAAMPDADPAATTLYGPRYSADESSDAAYERDQRVRRCAGRKRRATSAFQFVAFLAAAGVCTRAYLFFAVAGGGGPFAVGRLSLAHVSLKRRGAARPPWDRWRPRWGPADATTDQARADSGGFFEIGRDEWEARQLDTRARIDAQDDVREGTAHLLVASGADVGAARWWSENWKANFKCRNQVRIGGKWLCDPSRILDLAKEEAMEAAPPDTDTDTRRKRRERKRGKELDQDRRNACVVYVSGGDALAFATQFLEFSLRRSLPPDSSDQPTTQTYDPGPCEVHAFIPGGQEVPVEREGLFVHPWGFKPSQKDSMGVVGDGTTPVAFKTLQDTINELQHAGRLRILVLDCEQCEWDIYRDILALLAPTSIQQVLLQMHGAPYMANQLFLDMQEAGYVIFQREASAGQQEVYDYSWLRLAPSFFNWPV